MSRKCSIQSCDLPVCGRGWCKPHYSRFHRQGLIKVDRNHHVRSMTAVQIAWMAGIIEGEGTFVASLRRGKRKYPSMTVRMTDEDIVRRLHEFTGVGAFGAMAVRGMMTKPAYTWKVSRKADFAEICRIIQPYMGIRRSEQMHRVLKQCDLKIEQNVQPTE